MSLRLLAMFAYTPAAMGIALWRPLWGLFALFIMYYFRPDVWGAPTWFNPVEWITICCLAGWAIHARDVRTNLSLFLAGFLVLMMCVTSINAQASPEASWTSTNTIIKLIAIQFLIIQTVRTWEHLNQFLWVNVIGNLWTLKSVMVQALSGGDEVRVDVTAGQGGGANYLAMLFVMSLPLFFFKWLYGSPRERRWAMILAPLHVFGVVGTGSRGGYLSLFATLGYLAAVSKRKMQAFIAAFFIGIVFVATVPQASWQRFSGSVTDTEKGLGRRTLLWKTGIDMFLDAPVTGVGHRNYQLLSPRYLGFFAAGRDTVAYRPELENSRFVFGFVAHNTWIQMLADGGLICSIPFFGLFIYSFFVLRHARKIPLPPEHQRNAFVYSRVFEGILIAFCISSTFHGHFEIDCLWWYFGAISVFWMIVKRHSQVWRAGQADLRRRQIVERQRAVAASAAPAAT